MSFQISMILMSAIFVGFSISSAYSLRCYDCDSSTSSICKLGFTSIAMPVKDCSESSGTVVGDAISSILSNQCVKIIAKDSEGNQHVARGCIPNTYGGCSLTIKAVGFFSGLSGGASDANCYTCDTDKCNSTFNIRPSLTAIIMIGILFTVFKL